MSNKALLVGVNKYKMPGSDLSGCVNDVTNMRDILLKYFGFTTKEMRIFVDERATKKNIIDGLKWLVNKAKSNDRLLFHFSGHGSQIVDKDGDELKDRKDEIICPHDMDWDGTFITDDDLGKIFSALPKGANLDVFLDSCHSGTGTRDMAAIRALPFELSFKPRFLPPPADIAARADDEDMEVRKLLRGTNPLNHVLFSGCRDNQTSADAQIGGSYNGAFTYYTCKHLRDTKGSLSRSELVKRVRASLKFNGFSQVPQLEGPAAEKKKKMLE
jgi:hypothetical protein